MPLRQRASAVGKHSALGIVVVNWNGATLLEPCLAPLVYGQLQVVVVDNNSSDDSLDVVREKFPGIDVIANSTNLGYAIANNQGIRQVETGLVLLLNNDTIPNPATLDRLVEFFAAHPTAGVAGPSLANADGSPQPSCGPGPNLWTEFLGKTMLHRIIGGREWAPEVDRNVDWVTGAALCIRRDLALALGGLDEGFFMFYEDLDLCARVREAGYEVWFVATPPIVHLGGATRKRIEAKSLVDSYRSVDRYFAKHGPRWRWWIVRAMTIPEMILRSAVWGVMWLRRSRRQLAGERLRAYRSIVRLAMSRSR